MPEAATSLALAELLGCSLDQLMREELSEQLVSGNAPTSEEPALFQAYDRHMNRFAARIAFGAALVLAGTALLLALRGLGVPAWMMLPSFFLCLAAAVFLFITVGMEHDGFVKDHPAVPDCYDPEEACGFRRTFRTGLAALVAGILLDVALLVGLLALFEYDETVQLFSVALFLLILAGCAGGIVYLSLLSAKYDLDQYARDNAPATARRDWGGAIMLLATAVFLLTGWLWDAWKVSWVAFPVGGILCAVAAALTKK